MYKSKTLFLLMLIMGSFITLSSTNWISMWMGLELNLLSFIPLVSNPYNKSSSEASMIYFLTQSMSSMLLLMSLLAPIILASTDMFKLITMMSLLIKLGAAPFHMWVPEVMSKMNWENCIILMTWQKLAPMFMLSNMEWESKMMFIIIMMSVSVGAIGGLNQTSLRKLLGYSSINHVGWMLAMNSSQSKWMLYLGLYSVLTITLCMMFINNNMLFINQINNMNMTMMEKLTLSISMLSLGGLPPFTGFLLKWLAIQTMIESNSMMMMTLMIMFSLITLFYYMRTMTYMMINPTSVNKWNLVKSKQTTNIMIMITNMMLPLIMVMNLA